MTMARYSGVVTDQAGNIIPNAKIEVRRETPGAPLAALKDGPDGLVALTNPFNAESDGTFFFHVVGGFYKIRAYTGASSSPTFEQIIRYEGIGELQGYDLDAAGGGIESIVAGMNITVDDTDPANPVVSATGEIAPYLGHVATRTRIPYVWDNTATITLSRTRHTAKDNINNPQFVFPNWYVHGIGGSPDWQEKGPGSSATIQASIEYPVGQFTPIKFGGASSGVAASGDNLVSDQADIRIPRGEIFYIRTHYSNAGGVLVFFQTDTARGEACDVGIAGTPSAAALAGGTITDDGFTSGYGPCAIIAQTTLPSALVVGDSRAYGSGDTFWDASTNQGIIERAIGDQLPVLNASIPGDNALYFIASHSRRLALQLYCTHIIVQHGINDLSNGRTSGQVLADREIIADYFVGKVVLQATLEPVSTSSDSWATVTNQTTSGFEIARNAVNEAIRLSELFLEIADGVESEHNSGLWASSGTASDITYDGVHSGPNGVALGVRSRSIDLSKIAYFQSTKQAMNMSERASSEKIAGVVRLATVSEAVAGIETTKAVTPAGIAAKAPLDSPGLTGVPTTPTAAPGTNTTQIASTGFVKAAIDAVLGGVASAFDTLSEIATDLGLKALKATTITAGAGLTGGGDLSTSRSLAIDPATQAEQEAASITTKAVTPGRQHFHPGMAKAWAVFNGSGTPAVIAGYNVASITDNGVGDWTIVFNDVMSNTNYCVLANAEEVSPVDTMYPMNVYVRAGGKATGSVRVVALNLGGAKADYPVIFVAVFGDM